MRSRDDGAGLTDSASGDVPENDLSQGRSQVSDPRDSAELIADCWEWIFREQLNAWMRDPEPWPPELTQEMFREWFDCKVSTMVWDMLKGKIKSQF